MFTFWNIFKQIFYSINNFINPLILTSEYYFELIHEKKYTKPELFKKLGIKRDKKIMLIIQHPVLIEREESAKQIIETLEAIKKFDLYKILSTVDLI